MATTTLGQRRPGQRPGIVHYAVLEEMVIYSPEALQAASLNASARAIWELCDGRRTVDEICAELASRAGVSADDLRDDVSNAIDQLNDLALLTFDAA